MARARLSQQTPEGQAILSTTESEVIAELELLQSAAPVTSPSPTGAASPAPAAQPPAAAQAGFNIFNPRKVSSAQGEQKAPGG